jgi:alpha-methylacyl-CoA racemase
VSALTEKLPMREPELSERPPRSAASVSDEPTPERSASAHGPRGPLDGVRVVELAGIGPGPYACMMLADMGADVVQVQRPGRSPAASADPMMRSRRCLALDLKNAAAVEVVLRLIERADVLIEGYRPGVTERLGLGPDVCCVRNPRLVYGRITGWGQQGPLASRAGHDINYLALSGLLHQIGPPGGKPVPPLNVVADYGGGGLLLAFGIVCALQERQRSGRGQVIDAAMVDGAASFLATSLALRAQGTWRDAPGENFLSGAAHFYDTYATRDGRWVAIGAIEPQFHALLLSRLGLDPAEFAVGVGHMAAPYAELVESIWPRLRARLADAIARHTRDELQALFEGTDACVTPVLSLEEAMRHPHNVARRVFIDVDGARHNAPAPRFSRTPPAAPRTARHGREASEAVLAEIGYGPVDIDELRRSGVIG